MTVLSVDTGDLDVIAEMAATGFISDATTNPLFVSQAGLSGDPRYGKLVTEAVDYAKAKSSSELGGGGEDERVFLAMDRLAVNLGVEISKLVPGFVSTEVDPRLSFDTKESLRRARRIIDMYEAAGVPRARVLIKLAATWEGVQASRALEKDDGVTCNLTLVFGVAQAVACAQAGARLISPFTGRILDWHKAKEGYATVEPDKDPGVVAVADMFKYFKRFGHQGTIVMPASWRPSRGPGFELDEILALAGVDRMTIPPGLLNKLRECDAPISRQLDSSTAAAECKEKWNLGTTVTSLADEKEGLPNLDENAFRLLMNKDFCATAKLAEGLQAFIDDTDKLEAAIRVKMVQQ